MKTIIIDNELYLDRIVKVFFNDEAIPDQFKDESKYALVIIGGER